MIWSQYKSKFGSRLIRWQKLTFLRFRCISAVQASSKQLNWNIICKNKTEKKIELFWVWLFCFDQKYHINGSYQLHQNFQALKWETPKLCLISQFCFIQDILYFKAYLMSCYLSYYPHTCLWEAFLVVLAYFQSTLVIRHKLGCKLVL